MSKLPIRLLLFVGVGAAFSGCFTSQERSGQALYEQQCANCHGRDGEGLGTLMPPLAGADYLLKHRTALPCLVRRGQRGPITVNGQPYDGVMPAFSRQQLTDADVANILNYVGRAWGNAAPDAVTVPEVTACGE